MDLSSLLFLVGCIVSLLFGLYLGYKNGIETGMFRQALIDSLNLQEILDTCDQPTKEELKFKAQQFLDRKKKELS